MSDTRSLADQLAEIPPGAASDTFIAQWHREHPQATLHPNGTERERFDIEKRHDGSELATTGPLFLDDDGLGQLPGVEWDIQEILPTGGQSYLIGIRGTGKSLLAMDWAIHLTLGRDWNHRKVLQRPVVYVVAEGARSMHSRVEIWKSYHRHAGSTGVLWLPRRLLLREPTTIAEFTAALSQVETGPGLVIVDTLPRCIQGAAENDSDGMGEALAAVDTIRETGWGVLLVGHPSRDGGENPRGHSSQEGAADAIWVLKDHDGERLLTCSKNKDGDESATFSLSLVSHSLGVLLLPTSQAPVSYSLTPTQRMVLLTVRDTDHGPGVAAGVIIDTSRIPKASVYRALKTLVERKYLSVKSQRYSLTSAGLAGVVS